MEKINKLSRLQSEINNFHFISAKATLELMDTEQLKISIEKVSTICQILVSLQGFFLDTSILSERPLKELYANDVNFRSLTDKEQKLIQAESVRINDLYLNPKNNIISNFMFASCWVYNMDGMRACIWIYRTILAIKASSIQIPEELEDIMTSCRRTLRSISDVMPYIVEGDERPFALYNDFSFLEKYIKDNFQDNLTQISKDKNLRLNKIINNMSTL